MKGRRLTDGSGRYENHFIAYRARMLILAKNIKNNEKMLEIKFLLLFKNKNDILRPLILVEE